MVFATVADITALFRPLTNEETTRAEALIPVVSDRLRAEAHNVGKDLDEMVEGNSAFLNVVKSVTVDVVARTLMTSTSAEPLAQFSESANGYTVSGTYINGGGGGIFIKRDELNVLGLKRQQIGVINLNGNY